MLTEFFYVYLKFYADLPDDYEDFKAMTNAVFPK